VITYHAQTRAGWSSDAVSADTADNTYVSTHRPACSQIHRINPSTGMRDDEN